MRRVKAPLLGSALAAFFAVTLVAQPAVSAPDDPVHDAPPSAEPTVSDGEDGRTEAVLVTGDRLVVQGLGTADERIVLRGPGRDGVSFHTFELAGRLHVVPSDAIGLVAEGRLDLRLFDIAAVAEARDGTGELRLIVTHEGRRAARDHVLAVGRETIAGSTVLESVQGMAVRVRETELRTVWEGLRGELRRDTTGIEKVWLDSVLRPSLDASVPMTGAPVAWRAGYDGAGQTVAVLDTGIDSTHPDLVGKVAETRNFTDDGPEDTVGHGTHIASTIAGTGAASGGAYTGVAPGADLLDGKVCGEDGCYTSSIIAGMEWAAEQGAQVVNMSLGGANQPGIDPIEQAVERLTAQHGVLFVVAAGNHGPGAKVSSPASAPAALAIGAVSKDGDIAGFSSRGDVDGLVKPEIVAPGVGIVAARSKHSPESDGDASYVSSSGTSMATPHVAGAAAIIAQRHPDWSPEQRKAALVSSARPNPAVGIGVQGAGLLDVGRAATSNVTADPAVVNFGRAWDLIGSGSSTAAVTYHNAGSTPITLNLEFRGVSADGRPLPDGMVALSADTVTIPAGGDSEIAVTVEPEAGLPHGYAGGHLVATAEDVEVTTPVGVVYDDEQYDVKMRYAANGDASFFTYAFGLDAPSFALIGGDVNGRDVILRLPKGRHMLVHGVSSAQRTANLVQPVLDVTGGGQLVDVDGRDGSPIDVSIPNPDARMRLAEVSTRMPKAFRDDGGGTTVDHSVFVFNEAGDLDPFAGLYFGQSGPDRDYAGLTADLTTTWSERGGDGSLANSARVYYLSWLTESRAFAGLSERVRSRELAAVTTEYARQADDARGGMAVFSRRDNAAGSGTAIEMSFPLPFTRLEYFNDDSGVRWEDHFAELGPGLVELATSRQPGTVYHAGRRYSDSVNKGVFGPTVANPIDLDGWVTRTGDTLTIRPPTFADGVARIGDTYATTSESTTLYRDDILIAEAPRSGYLMDCDILPGAARMPFGAAPCPTGLTAQVPADSAEYRVVVTADRGAPHNLSTHVSASWTFRSSHVEGDQPERLPLMTLRLTPPLDDENAAPAGRSFTIPVVVDRQPGSTAGDLRELQAEVSYDDGATWREARVFSQGPGRGFRLTAQHPSASGYVSIRARGTDSFGNIVEQTVLRAYRIS